MDTPGFGDSSGRDNQLIMEMMEVLDGQLGHANIIMLVIDGNTPRFTSGLSDMLRQMSSIFGETWWDFMMIGVSKWKLDQASIDERQAECDYYGDPSENCKNEAWFMRELNAQLQDKFGLQRNFTFAFTDSYSQSGPNLDDQVQQQHWQEETGKLWEEATKRNETFDFKTIDDVLEENAACKAEVQRLHDIIDEEIANLKANVEKNSDSISYLSSDLVKVNADVVENQDKIQKVNNTGKTEHGFADIKS